ncbi:MAG: molybdopterin-dependent oxidoreductase [Proteobacteria bacterium]|nr:molybdopterin-dependent oxidoreductase [Pseudomonadota bacterium]MBU4009755.1 molybdopterin-dependent oxidoreductase [Pseudomonadota bacterium]
MSDKKEVKTLCGMCLWACGIIVSLEDEKIVKIKGDPDHPWNKGRLCPKSAKIIDHFYSPQRVKYPMKKVGGNFQRISWDDALETMASGLNKIKDSYGPEAWTMIVGMAVQGQGFNTMHFLQRFCDAFGSPNFITPETFCFLSGITANMLTMGKFPYADQKNSKCIVLWGHNPSASNFIAAEKIKYATDNGAKLVVIDPRKIALAKNADIFAQIRPGTDCALALALIKIIIQEELYDKEFVKNWTSGFEQLQEHIKTYDIKDASRITWIPLKTIESIAHTYASIKPASILQGTNSLDQHPTGFQNNRALAILEALTGNIDVPGGHLISGTFPNFAQLRLPDLVKGKNVGYEKYPLFAGDWTGQGMLLPDMMLTGKPHPMKGLAVIASNPVLTWPNSNKLKKALECLDFLAVMTTVPNETSEMADLVLPGATFLERTEVWDGPLLGSMGYMSIRNKVTEYHESWSEIKFWLNLARHMGYEKYFPWQDDDEVFKHVFKDTGINIDEYLGKTNMIPFGGELKYKTYEETGFPTPTGKIELFSTIMQSVGFDPMPTFTEPPESPINDPETAKEYPVILTTGSRVLQYTHSSYRETYLNDKKAPEPYAEIHPATAGYYGIGDEEVINVATKRGAIQIRARLTEDILPHVINIPHAWANSNVNLLTDEKSVDPVTGYPALKALLCKISPVKK